tara:strand:+ start:52 stop:606 length:555 start_codon:yes stop_codon:yes gene_type:complete
MALTKVSGSGADGLTLSSTDVTIASGDLLFGTADKGVVLGVTSNSNANTLDDYEEGTFTATLSGDSSGTGTITNGSGGTATCRYTKIGRLVYCELSLILSDLGSISGRVIIGGFPFAAGFFGGQGAVRNQGLGGDNTDGIVFEMNQGATTGRFHFNSSSTTQRSVQHSDATNGDFVGVGITYSV